MKKFMLTLLSLSFLSSLNAQNPLFQWVKQMGDASNDFGNSITTDSAGNIYTAGYFNGTADFDPGPGVYTLTSAGVYDIYVSKLNPSGNFVWAKKMGGTGWDFGTYIAHDFSGNVYTIGIFQGTADFDPGPGVYTLTSTGCYDAFISKLDSAGNFIWARSMGGTNDDYGNAIAVDPKGYVYFTGTFLGAVDFDPGPGTYSLNSSGSSDNFILKLDPSGSFVWAKSVGGAFEDHANGIAVNSIGNVYATGSFKGTADFDPGPGAFNLVSAGNNDVFILRLDASGNFVWAKRLGGANDDFAYAIALDNLGNAYTSGYYSGTADFDPGPASNNLISSGNSDVFISKLDPSGNYAWAKSMGGTYEDVSFALTCDASANVYLTGYFSGAADFDPGPAVYTMSSAGGYDIFTAKIDGLGNFVWAKKMGGAGNDKGNGIVVDASSSVFTTGGFNVTADFDPGPGVFNLTSAGSNDIFIHKIAVMPPMVGIPELENTLSINIFPNPNNGLFQLEVNGCAEVTISNSLGETVCHEKICEAARVFDIQKLTAGIYFVKVANDNQQRVFRMVKQ